MRKMGRPLKDGHNCRWDRPGAKWWTHCSLQSNHPQRSASFHPLLGHLALTCHRPFQTTALWGTSWLVWLGLLTSLCSCAFLPCAFSPASTQAIQMSEGAMERSMLPTNDLSFVDVHLCVYACMHVCMCECMQIWSPFWHASPSFQSAASS